MNCSNLICNKPLQLLGIIFTCNKCQQKLCSNKCLNFHLAQEHPERDSKIAHSLMKSIFMKKGKIIKEFVDDPYFDFKKFEFIRGKTNKIVSLGAGSFGHVYLAKHTQDSKLFAVKYIKKEKVRESGQSVDIIYREILLQRSFLHDNIVRLYQVIEDKDNFFMIMEYMPNGTLFSHIRKNKGFEEKEAFNYFIQACSAIYFLHENGYAHRDLKPENLLLDDKGNLKLCDFGWCVDVTTGERATFCGTYEYMAPEIVKEIPYDQSIDIWSLGVLLYELLHGYSPFRDPNDKRGNNFEEIAKNIARHKYVIEKDISKNCEDLISKLLNPNHKERIKINDIFKHPWVVYYEKEYKKDKLKEDGDYQRRSDKTNSNDKISLLVNDLLEKEPEKTSAESNNKKSSYKMESKQLPKFEESFTIFQDNVFENAMKNVETKKKKVIKSESLSNKNSKLIASKLNNNEFSIFSNKIQEIEDINVNNNNHENDNGKILHSKTHSISVEKKPKEEKKEKKDKLFIEETPTPYYEDKPGSMGSVLGIFQKADELKKEQERKVPVIRNEPSFWEKLFAPFKCGDQ